VIVSRRTWNWFIQENMKVFLPVAALASLASCAGASNDKPNIIWFVTDDQDQMLGGSFPQINGAGPMAKTKELMSEAGSMAERFYIHTPICNPSRSELLSGRYFHNIKSSDVEEWMMHVNESLVNSDTFVKDLKEKAGYNTGMFGKYMNVMPTSVPPGFDVWMANGGGNYIAPEFQIMNVTGLVPGMQPSGDYDCWLGGNHTHDAGYGCFEGTTDPSNYSTSVIGNVSMAWIRKVVSEDPQTPFFAYIAPKAAHEPFNPAPWYEGVWSDDWCVLSGMLYDLFKVACPLISVRFVPPGLQPSLETTPAGTRQQPLARTSMATSQRNP